MNGIMINVAIVLAVSLGLSFSYHLGFRRTFGKAWPSFFNTGDPTYWPVMLTFTAALGMVVAHLITAWPARFSPMLVVGLVVALFGNFWNRWAYRVLGENYRPTAYNDEAPPEPIKEGPYKWMRHPVYFGQTVFLIGLILIVGGGWPWFGLALFLPAITWRILRENRFLTERYGR